MGRVTASVCLHCVHMTACRCSMVMLTTVGLIDDGSHYEDQNQNDEGGPSLPKLGGLG